MEINNYTPGEMAQRVLDSIQKELKTMNKLNIMVLGKTGVGKSTLVNRMFGEKIVDTGIGKPVTMQIQKIEKAGIPLAIFDTPGLELSGENAVESLLTDVGKVITEGQRSGDISQMIHCIWYCVGVPGHKFEESEASFLKRLREQTQYSNIPIIMVLTQAYNKKETIELKSKITEQYPDLTAVISAIVSVLADDYNLNDEYVARAFGLKTLSEIMNDTVPEAVQKTFVAMQSVNLDLKVKRAHAAVTAAAATAAGIGATPIPFSDAVLLVPAQIGMLTGITAIFGLPVEKATLSALLSSTVGTAGTTVLGKTVVTNLLKCIPGGGSAVGGAIAAAAAAALTAALGEAYISVLTKVCKGEFSLSELKTDDGKKLIEDTFKARLKFKRKKDGTPEE